MVFKSGFTMKIKTNVSQTMLVQLKEHHLGLKPSNKHWNNMSLPMWYLWTSCNTDLLVGNDYYDIISTKWVILSDGLYLFGSRFECILSGRKKSEYTAPKRDSLTILTYSLSGISTNSLGFNKTDESIFNNSHLEDFWALETIEIKDSLTITDDDKALP